MKQFVVYYHRVVREQKWVVARNDKEAASKVAKENPNARVVDVQELDQSEGEE